MAAPEYMHDLRKRSPLGFGVYSWLQLVDLVSRHDMSVSYIVPLQSKLTVSNKFPKLFCLLISNTK